MTCRPVTRTTVFNSSSGGKSAPCVADLKSGWRHALSVWGRGPLGVVLESDFPERPIASLSTVVEGRCLLSPKLMEKY